MKFVGAFEDEEDEGLFPSRKPAKKDASQAKPQAASGSVEERGGAPKVARGSAGARPVLADDEPVNFFAQFSIEDDDDDLAPAPKKCSTQAPTSPSSQEQATPAQPAEPSSPTLAQPVCGAEDAATTAEPPTAEPTMEEAATPSECLVGGTLPDAQEDVDPLASGDILHPAPTMPDVPAGEPSDAEMGQAEPITDMDTTPTRPNASDTVGMPVMLAATTPTGCVSPPTSSLQAAAASGAADGDQPAAPLGSMTSDTTDVQHDAVEGQPVAVLVGDIQAEDVSEGRFSFGVATKQLAAGHGDPSSPASVPSFTHVVASASNTIPSPTATATTLSITGQDTTAAAASVDKLARGVAAAAAAVVTVSARNSASKVPSTNPNEATPSTPKAHDPTGSRRTRPDNSSSDSTAFMDSPVAGMLHAAHHTADQLSVCEVNASAPAATAPAADKQVPSESARFPSANKAAAPDGSVPPLPTGAGVAGLVNTIKVHTAASAPTCPGGLKTSITQPGMASTGSAVQTTLLAPLPAAPMDVCTPTKDTGKGSLTKQSITNDQTGRGSGSLGKLKPSIPQHHGMQVGTVATSTHTTTGKRLPQQQLEVPRASGGKQPRVANTSHVHHKPQADPVPVPISITVAPSSETTTPHGPSSAARPSVAAAAAAGPMPARTSGGAHTPTSAAGSDKPLPVTASAPTPAAGFNKTPPAIVNVSHPAPSQAGQVAPVMALPAAANAAPTQSAGSAGNSLAANPACGMVKPSIAEQMACALAGAVTSVPVKTPAAEAFLPITTSTKPMAPTSSMVAAISSPSTAVTGMPQVQTTVTMVGMAPGAGVHNTTPLTTHSAAASPAIAPPVQAPAATSMLGTAAITAADMGVLELDDSAPEADVHMAMSSIAGSPASVPLTSGTSTCDVTGDLGLLPSELLDRSGAMQKLEMMLLQARSLQVQVAETRAQSAVLRNRLLRLDNPLMRLRLAQAGAWQAAAAAAATSTYA